MKKLVTLVALSAIGVGSAMAQGTFAFKNNNTYALMVTDGVTSNKVGSAGAALGPSSTIVGLWLGAPGATFAQMTLVGITTNSPSTSALFAGTFNAGSPVAIDTTKFPLAAGGAGTLVSFAYGAWSDLTTLDARTKPPTTGYLGWSLIGNNYALGGGSTIPLDSVGPTAGSQVPGWVLTQVSAVPEPTTFALAGLGLASLLIFRRRK